uniref:Uncharacterized protein n=1 Tax=Rhizophora mucronata TaxID=61149 RepID=A0A2P2QXN3_RHIMU
MYALEFTCCFVVQIHFLGGARKNLALNSFRVILVWT